MKKLIVALLLCLIPLESYAGARADRYRPKRDPKLAREIIDHIVNTTADSVYALNKSLYWVEYKREKLLFMHCVTGMHNGKPYNKKFCESISKYRAVPYFVKKIELTLKEQEYSECYESLLRELVQSYMDEFFEEDKDNIIITEASYVEPGVNCGDRCKAFFKGVANVAASVVLPGPAYRVVSAVQDMM